MRFFKWCRSLDAITGYRRIWFGSEVQEIFIITSKMFWILKKIRLHFLDQLQAMFNSNEILNYLSDYRFAIFIRIAVQINTKAFLSVQFVRELGKTGNNETKNNNRRAKKQEHVMR